MRGCLLALGMVLFGTFNSASAQLPFPPKGGEGQRLPNDNVEGTVFEYYGKLQGTPKNEDEDRKLAGKFRIEGSAVFDVSPTFALPSKGEVKKAVDGIVAGKGANLKLPSGPQQKRLGEYRKISTGKLRFDFNDKESLHGIMIVQKKKNTDDVYIGTFTEREGTKVMRTWEVELRPIQD
jgi:hypothetical protein